MNCTELQESILKSVEPMVKISQFCGITYFSKKMRRWKFVTAYRIFIILLLVGCMVHEIPTILFWIGKSKKLHMMLTLVETSSRWLILFINSLTNMFRNEEISQIISCLTMLEVRFDINSLARVRRFQVLQLIFNLTVLTIYMILGHHFVWENSNHVWYTSLIYTITEFYIAFGNMQFVSFLFVLREYYRTINSRVRGLNKRGRWSLFYDNVKNIKECRESHLILFNVSRKLSKCYSIQLLLFVILSMIEIMYSLTSLVSYITYDRNSELWRKKPFLACFHMLSWSGYYVLNILQIVGICECTVSESRRSSFVIHDLINKNPNTQAERELELFSVQVLKNDLKFSACGFFTLNLPLFYSIAAAVAAYILSFISLRDKQ